MLSTERVLLRQHVEAVWGVQLPPLVNDDCELLSTSFQPSWQLYVADITDVPSQQSLLESESRGEESFGASLSALLRLKPVCARSTGTSASQRDARILIWRPDVSRSEREELRQYVDETLDFSLPLEPSMSISREVALSFTASPVLDLESARLSARPLTLQDYPLLKNFQPDAPSGLLASAKRPLVGVIDSDCLLCLAHSSRRTIEACELGIDTLPTARRKGHALAATVVWTYLILQEGLVPLYSAFAENTASLHLAAKAGFRAFTRGATFKIKKCQS